MFVYIYMQYRRKNILQPGSYTDLQDTCSIQYVEVYASFLSIDKTMNQFFKVSVVAGVPSFQ